MTSSSRGEVWISSCAGDARTGALAVVLATSCRASRCISGLQTPPEHRCAGEGPLPSVYVINKSAQEETAVGWGRCWGGRLAQGDGTLLQAHCEVA